MVFILYRSKSEEGSQLLDQQKREHSVWPNPPVIGKIYTYLLELKEFLIIPEFLNSNSMLWK